VHKKTLVQRTAREHAPVLVGACWRAQQAAQRSGCRLRGCLSVKEARTAGVHSIRRFFHCIP
jgi:hypothetical protein